MNSHVEEGVGSSADSEGEMKVIVVLGDGLEEVSICVVEEKVAGRENMVEEMLELEDLAFLLVNILKI